MRGSESIFFFLAVFTFVVVFSWIHRRSKEREQRLKLIEKALDKPGLDDDTKRMLAEHLRGGVRRLPAGASRFGLSHLMLVAGWLGVFIGIAIAATGSRRDEEVGIVFILVSAGLLTLPFALKEFERRRPA